MTEALILPGYWDNLRYIIFRILFRLADTLSSGLDLRLNITYFVDNFSIVLAISTLIIGNHLNKKFQNYCTFNLEIVIKIDNLSNML